MESLEEACWAGAAEFAIECSSGIGVFNLAFGVGQFVLGNSLEIGVPFNGRATRVSGIDYAVSRIGRVMEEEAGRVLFENGARVSVSAVDQEGAVVRGVHGDATDVADFREGQDVGKGVGMVPDKAEVFESALLRNNLFAVTVCLKAESFVNVMDVGKEMGIAKDGDGGVAIKKDEVGGDAVGKMVLDLSEDETDLGEGATAGFLVGAFGGLFVFGVGFVGTGGTGVASVAVGVAMVPMITVGVVARTLWAEFASEEALVGGFEVVWVVVATFGVVVV